MVLDSSTATSDRKSFRLAQGHPLLQEERIQRILGPRIRLLGLTLGSSSILTSSSTLCRVRGLLSVVMYLVQKRNLNLESRVATSRAKLT
mmetsp:Transcript_30406/g.50505  ORF Transcript_30406/g.50505 Transcript_30406/m.50505 type:complete len:90 (+) Transcript_30406:1-270(+)